MRFLPLLLLAAPLPGDPVAESEVVAFLERFDAAHASGNPDEVVPYLAATPSNARVATEQWIRAQFADPGVRGRASRLLHLRLRDGAAGAYVETDLVLEASPPGNEGFVKERRLHEFLLLRREGGALRLVRRLDFSPEFPLPPDGDPTGCEACGWTVTPPPGWFAVPWLRTASGATEAVFFVRAEGDSTMELNVLQSSEDWSPLEATGRDDEKARRQYGDPPGCREILRRTRERDDELAQAESEFSLPLGPKAEGRILRTYVACGPILFAFSSHGPSGAVERTRGEFEALTGSLRLRPAGPDRAAEDSAKLSVHQPGVSLEEGCFVYRTPTYAFAFDSPKGLAGSLLTTAGPFRVCFRCGITGARIDAYGSERSPGWTSEASIAEELDRREEEIDACGTRSLSRLGSRAEVSLPGLEIPAYRTDLAWVDDEGGRVRERCVLLPLPDAAVFLRVLSREEWFDVASSAFDALLRTIRIER